MPANSNQRPDFEVFNKIINSGTKNATVYLLIHFF